MILVTGGQGFIGRYVCAALTARGKPVLSLDDIGATPATDQSSTPVVRCDIGDKHQVEQVFARHSFSTIIHLASILNTASFRNPSNATRVNIGGSLNLFEVARQFGIPRVIYASSISVYGSKSGYDLRGVPETEPAAPEDVYGAAKRYVEVLGEVFRQQFGFGFIALRISTVIGPGAQATSSPWRSMLFEKLGQRDAPGALVNVAIPYRRDEALPLVHVQDVGEMFARLAEGDQVKHTIYNTPSETWMCGELATCIESLAPNMNITFGHSRVKGIPNAINGERFMHEFSYTPTPLRVRLQNAARP